MHTELNTIVENQIPDHEILDHKTRTRKFGKFDRSNNF